MKDWEGRTPKLVSYRVFTPQDDERLRPLALQRAARLKGRATCFVCDAPIQWEDELGRTLTINPPVLVVLDVGLSIRLPACRAHPDLGEWPPDDYELAAWMVRHGWGEPMDPAMLGDAQ